MHWEPLVAVPTDVTPTRREPMLESGVRSRPPAVPSLAEPGMWQKAVAQFVVTRVAPSLPPVQLPEAVPPVPVDPPVGLLPPVPLPLPPVPVPLLPPVFLNIEGSSVPGQPDSAKTVASAPAAPANPTHPETWLRRGDCIGDSF